MKDYYVGIAGAFGFFGFVGAYSLFQSYPVAWFTVAIFKVAIWLLGFTSLAVTTLTATLTACLLVGMVVFVVALMIATKLPALEARIGSNRAKEALDNGGKPMSVEKERDLLIRKYGRR